MSSSTPGLTTASRPDQAMPGAWQAISTSTSIALYCVDTNGIINFWNPGACTIFGYSESDILDQNWLQLAPPESSSELNKTLAKVLRGRVVPVQQLSFKRKNSSTFSGRYSLHPFHNLDTGAAQGAIVLTTDISDLIKADQKLQDRAKQIKAIVETVVDAIITIDDQGIIEAANPAVEAIFGYRPHELIGLNISTLMPEPYRSAHDGYIKRFRETRQARIIGIGREVSGQRKNGEIFPMELAVSTMHIDGRESFVGVVKDISERKRHEAELEAQYKTTDKLNRELQDTLHELKKTQHELVEAEKLAALGSVVAGLAHEINTPIGISTTAVSHLEGLLKKNAENFKKGELTQSGLTDFFTTGQEATNLLQRNLQRSAELVNTFKRLSIETRREDIHALSDESIFVNIIATINSELRKFQCRCELNARIEHSIRVDVSALNEVLRNLALNAAIHGYQEKGGTVSISVHTKPDMVIFQISDEGVGMTPEVADKIFDPFFTTRRNRGGLGLGLHLVYNLVKQALHGSISVETWPGKGTCFTLQVLSVNDGERSSEA